MIDVVGHTNKSAPFFIDKIMLNVVGADDTDVTVEDDIGDVVEMLHTFLTQRSFSVLLPV